MENHLMRFLLLARSSLSLARLHGETLEVALIDHHGT